MAKMNWAKARERDRMRAYGCRPAGSGYVAPAPPKIARANPEQQKAAKAFLLAYNGKDRDLANLRAKKVRTRKDGVEWCEIPSAEEAALILHLKRRLGL